MKNTIKTNSETVVIKMSDFYPDNVGGEEFCEVSREVYDYLIAEKRKEKRVLRKDWLHVSKYPFDEKLMGEMDGIYEQSADDIMSAALKDRALYKAIKALDPVFRRRLVLYYFEEKSNKEIAEIEDITPSAVTQSLNAAIEMLGNLLKVRDVL